MSSVVLRFGDGNFRPDYKFLSYDKSKFENDWNSSEHSHPYSEILFVTGGKGSFVNGGEVRPVETGTLVVTNPYVAHTEISAPAPEAPLQYTVISLADIYFASENSDEFLTKSYVFDFPGHRQEFRALLAKIDAEIGAKKPFWQAAVLGAVNELLILILRLTGLNNFRAEEPLPMSGAGKAVWLCSRYMETYFAQKITLDFLAEKFFVNKYHLIRSFRLTLGCTPMQYLARVRMAHAEDLLKNTDLSVTEIAAQTGFSSASRFAEAYKKRTGKSPLQAIKR